ncbi:choline dehydrogenases [Zymobacter palmae]|uniref:Choline dehydrogenases n=1 Tax=Zymobacter palmae TaxID=33074 RepID=A0A348HH22_9GAMM|nr:choline dehydrogenases [Zymobacter palmae]
MYRSPCQRVTSRHDYNDRMLFNNIDVRALHQRTDVDTFEGQYFPFSTDDTKTAMGFPMAVDATRDESGVDAVGRTVPTTGNVTATLTIAAFLLRVGDFDARVVELDQLGRQILSSVSAARGCLLTGSGHAFDFGGRYDDFFEFHFEITHLFTTGTVDVQCDFLDVLTTTAGFKQFRRGLIEELADAEFAQVHAFCRSTTRGASRGRSRLRCAEIEAQQLDPIFVFGI